MEALKKQDKKVSAVLPNYRNKDFVNVLLDSQSKKFFLKNFTKIEDELDSCMIIRNLANDATYTGENISDTCEF